MSVSHTRAHTNDLCAFLFVIRDAKKAHSQQNRTVHQQFSAIEMNKDDDSSDNNSAVDESWNINTSKSQPESNEFNLFSVFCVLKNPFNTLIRCY